MWINKKDWGLGNRSFWKACYFCVLAIDPFAQLAEDIDSLKSCEDVSLFSALTAFAVTCMSCHKILSNFRDESGWSRGSYDCIFMRAVAEF
jgi:hypothetical protein